MDTEPKSQTLGNVLYLDQAELIPEFVNDGLKVVCICERGEARGEVLSEQLNDLSVKSVTLEKGIKGILKLSNSEREELVSNLSLVPNIILRLSGFEAKRYKDQIDLLNSQRERPVILQSESPVMPQLVGKLLV